MTNLTVNEMLSPRGHAQFWRGRSALIQWAVAIVTLVLVIGPMLPVVYQSFLTTPLYDPAENFSLANFRLVFADPAYLRALANTFVLALCSTVVATVFGVGSAVLVGRTNMPGRTLISAAVISPLVLSHLVLAFGWFMSYGPAGFVTLFLKQTLGIEFINMYSMTGIVLVTGVVQAPLTFLYCTASNMLADRTLEDVARTCGARPRTALMRITLPLMMPAIAYSAALNFASGLETLSIPLVFGEPAGIRFLTTILYTEGLNAPIPRHGLVAAVAVLLIGLGLILIWLQRLMLRNSARYVSVKGKATRPRVFDIGGLRWAAFALAMLYIVTFIVVPIGILFLRSIVSFLTPLVSFWTLLTPRWYAEVVFLPDVRRAILNTFFVSGMGAFLGTVFLALVAVVIHRSRFRFARELEYLILIPRALPGIVAGLGIFYSILLFPAVGWLRDTLWVIILAYVIRYMPTGYGSLSPAIIAISRDLDNSARTMGADWWSATWNTVLKIIRPAMISCFIVLFLLFFKEYTIALYLFAPDSEVIGTKLLNYFVNGNMGRVAALATFQILVTTALVIAARRYLGVNVHG